MEPVNAWFANVNHVSCVNHPISVGMVVPLVAFRNDVMVWHSEMSGVFKKAHATYICCMVGMVGIVVATTMDTGDGAVVVVLVVSAGDERPWIPTPNPIATATTITTTITDTTVTNRRFDGSMDDVGGGCTNCTMVGPLGLVILLYINKKQF